jgi:hypothetical protein
MDIKRPAATEQLSGRAAEHHIMAGMAFAFSPEMVKQTMGDGDENRKFGERDARFVLFVSQSRRRDSTKIKCYPTVMHFSIDCC